MRPDGREADALRSCTLTRGVNRHAEGSALIECGGTRVLCAASVEERLPPFLRGSKRGWLTAQYGMLPRATSSRNDREAARGKQSGRTVEIQRLIGRSLRGCMNFAALGERTITLDCDVLEADGGTRTASITGAWVALFEAGRWLVAQGACETNPVVNQIAAISTGLIEGEPRLDLAYLEDKNAEVDFNVVMNAAGEYIEIQGTAEGRAFSGAELARMLDLARSGIATLLAVQTNCLESAA